MSDYVIITDTCCDLPFEYTQKHGVDIIPICYELDGTVYGDEVELSPEDFYVKMLEGYMPTTMACNPESVSNHFKTFLEQGTHVIYICFSSGLSSSFNTASMVGRDLSEEYPDRKIVVIDSLCAAMGEGLLVHKAVCNKEKEMSFEENVAWLEENKLHICHQFTVNDLHHLHRGGRVSKTTAIIGTMINVKPVLHVDNEGKLISLSNVRGRKKALNALVDNMAKTMGDYENDIVFISHGDCVDDANYVAEKVKERFGIKEVMINYVCSTIGAHTGPGVVTLFFMGETR